MKFETLIKKYSTLGYVPKHLDDEIELECLINWVYKRFNYFIYLQYFDYLSQKAYKKVMPKMPIGSFGAHHVLLLHDKNKHDVTFSAEKWFKTPFDAKFHTVKQMYKVLETKVYYEKYIQTHE
jgi:hypothetical protein